MRIKILAKFNPLQKVQITEKKLSTINNKNIHWICTEKYTNY